MAVTEKRMKEREIRYRITGVIIVEPGNVVRIQWLIADLKGPQGPWVNPGRLFGVFE